MKIGDTFHDYHGRKCHVRGFVDGMVVYRFWRASKQYWKYEVDDLEFLPKSGS